MSKKKSAVATLVQLASIGRDMDIQARQFAIELGKLTSRFIEGGLPPKIALMVLLQKVAEEERMLKSQNAQERSY